MLRTSVFLAALAAAPAAFAQTDAARDRVCPAERRAEASARLEAIRTEDQADRTGGIMSEDAAMRDIARRREVATIFADGCFSTGRDYHNAALIFQHGGVPEHYYQAWLFARRAVELGDSEAQWLVTRAIDRYLMNTGYKQVFATNLISNRFLDPDSTDPIIWCVWPTVDALDDAQRTAAGGAALQAQLERAARMNAETSGQGGICTVDAADPPHGLFPGSW